MLLSVNFEANRCFVSSERFFEKRKVDMIESMAALGCWFS